MAILSILSDDKEKKKDDEQSVLVQEKGKGGGRIQQLKKGLLKTLLPVLLRVISGKSLMISGKNL